MQSKDVLIVGSEYQLHINGCGAIKEARSVSLGLNRPIHRESRFRLTGEGDDRSMLVAITCAHCPHHIVFLLRFSGICRATPKRAVSNGVLRPPTSQRTLVKTSFIMAPEQVNQSQIDSDHTANDIPGSEDQVESAQVG